jgi:hypothetical protein
MRRSPTCPVTKLAYIERVIEDSGRIGTCFRFDRLLVLTGFSFLHLPRLDHSYLAAISEAGLGNTL